METFKLSECSYHPILHPLTLVLISSKFNFFHRSAMYL